MSNAEEWITYKCKSCDYECRSLEQAQGHLIARGHKEIIPIKHKLFKDESEQPTNKYDNGKPRLDLVPPAIIEAVGEVRTYGIKKYGDSESWKTVEPERYRAAMMRHLCAYLRDPESIDEESGINHLHHAACNIAFLLEMEKEKNK